MKLKLISTFHLPALSHSISFCLTIPLALSQSPSIIFSPILSPIPSHPFFLANPLFLSYFLCLPLFFSLLLSSTSSFLVNLSFSSLSTFNLSFDPLSISHETSLLLSCFLPLSFSLTILPLSFLLTLSFSLTFSVSLFFFSSTL